jgi:hyperosmotically inducible protein
MAMFSFSAQGYVLFLQHRRIPMKTLSMTLVLVSVAVLGPVGCMNDQNARANSANEQPSGYGAKTGQYIDDSVLTTKVKTALAAHDSLKTLVLHVDSDKGVITISGTVHSQDQSDQVIQIARGVEGVRAVNNQLNIKAAE